MRAPTCEDLRAIRNEHRGGAVVLRLLRAQAAWWWRSDRMLRSAKPGETEANERRSVRESLRTLREVAASGGFLHVGRGGATLHGQNVQAGCHAGMEEAGRHLFPTVDTTTCPDPFRLVSLPMAKVGIEEREACPEPSDTLKGGLSGAFGWLANGGAGPGALDYVPVAVYARMAAELGATCTGFPEGTVPVRREVPPDPPVEQPELW